MNVFPYNFLHASQKILANWITDDDSFIDVNKWVCNTLEANLHTTSVARFETSKLELRPLTDWASIQKTIPDMPSQ